MVTILFVYLVFLFKIKTGIFPKLYKSITYYNKLIQKVKITYFLICCKNNLIKCFFFFVNGGNFLIKHYLCLKMGCLYFSQIIN